MNKNLPATSVHSRKRHFIDYYDDPVDSDDKSVKTIPSTRL